ncbi:MAG TPA: hypothetical protein VIK81_01655 [Patescibacteria group bacterium]
MAKTPEKLVKSEEELPQELKNYLREMFDVLCVQAGVLSVAGMSHGRSPFSVVQIITSDFISKTVNDSDFLYKNDLKSSPFEFFRQQKEKLESGNVFSSNYNFTDDQINLLVKLRAIYFWLEQVSERKDSGNLPYYIDEITLPVRIVGQMLDPLVDLEEAQKLWKVIKNDHNNIERFVDNLKFEINSFDNF